MSVSFEAIIKNVLDISTIDPTRYVAPWRQSRWIVTSSCFFLVPCVYGYMREQYLLSAIALLTSIFSINFWRDATYSYRRSMDCIFAKISFFVYMISGVPYVTSIPFVVTGYSALFTLIYCYYMSNKHGDSDLWWKYHMMFHLLVSYTQIVAIKCISDYTLNNDLCPSNE